MIYGSVCSGIEAASVAWAPLGWRPAFLSEIAAFPRAVLQHRFPDVPLRGDFTEIARGDHADIDLLVGGTPCQSFSIAGLRGGMDDGRGLLALEYLRLAQRLRPRWVVWENVPGVLSSNGGRDFGAFLGGLVELGYGFAYRVLDAQYVRVDGYARAVPQRRRRVFVVGCAGGQWQRAAAVLLERASLRWDPPPRREAGEGAAGALAAGAPGRGWRVGADEAAAAQCVTTGTGRRYDPETETLVAHTLRAQPQASHRADSDNYVAHTLRSAGADASEDGTGRGVPLAFDTTGITSPGNRSAPRPGDPCHTLAKGQHAPAVAFNARQDPDVSGDVTHPLGAKDTGHGVHGVRRLMPVECERLQGLPDDWTLVPYGKRGRPAKDGPRYAAIGNSMAANVMRWIGRRIEAVDRMAA